MYPLFKEVKEINTEDEYVSYSSTKDDNATPSHKFT